MTKRNEWAIGAARAEANAAAYEIEALRAKFEAEVQPWRDQVDDAVRRIKAAGGCLACDWDNEHYYHTCLLR